MVLVNVSHGNYSQTIEVNLILLERERIAALTIAVLNQIILLYLLGAALYSCVAGKRHAEESGSSEGSINYKIAFKVLKMIIAKGALTYTGILISLFVTEDNFDCIFYHAAHAIFPSFVLFATFFSVWLRVYHLFYDNPLIRSSIKRRAVILIKVSIVYFLVIVITNTTLLITSPTYFDTPYGCVKMQIPTEAIIRWIVFGITNTIFLIILCYLFVHPLRQHKKLVAKSGIETGNLTPLVKRLVITTCVCVTCNVAAVIVSIVDRSRFAYIPNAIQNTALVINLLAVICMLEDWHTWLIPCSIYARRPLRGKSSSNRKAIKLSSQNHSSGKQTTDCENHLQNHFSAPA